MTDSALLTKAIDRSGLSVRQFARQVLGVNDRTVRRWLSGETAMRQPVQMALRAYLVSRKTKQESTNA